VRDLRVRLWLVLLVCAAVVGGLITPARVGGAGRGGAGATAGKRVLVASQTGGRTAPGPNIVFVLTDDLSVNLLQFMPHVLAMQRSGVTFDDYFVSDSLCCPSRSSILTGNFPHDTGVYGNFGRHGGFHAFHARGEERRTFAVALQRSGYLTAMMGKFLNGYMQVPGRVADGALTGVPATYVSPGWTEWDVAGWGYSEFDYTLNENGRLHAFGNKPSDYLTDVLAHKGAAFIHNAAQRRRPFMLELATFAPHAPYVPAPRHAKDYPGLKAPRLPSFDVLPSHAPQWLSSHPPLSARQTTRVDSAFRLRARSVEAVDELIGQIQAALRRNGVAGTTYVVFSSDNGLHTGEYRLMPGKLTAFDTDIHVPLVVTGPGVLPGTSTNSMAENIDLAKTFTAIGGTNLPGDGHSLLPLLEGQTPAGWRNAILVEHRGARFSVLDPDFQQPASGNPTTYEAMRTKDFLYVEYADGERDFYALRTDPFELHNLAGRLPRAERAALHAELRAMRHCHTGEACWAAMHVGSSLQPPLATH
jgi:N-acetylglucosamine-6-sulfatase